ncbi:MAG: hypothetical protein Kow0010_20470 [Dehalococcoidia bacterium]
MRPPRHLPLQALRESVYRRTKVTFQRDPRTGKKRRRVILRDESKWIEVEDVTPPIIDRQT